MPIYEYACQQCGNEFEMLVRSDTVPGCPKCHSSNLEKSLSVFATVASTAQAQPAAESPCASCCQAGGQGSCAFG